MVCTATSLSIYSVVKTGPEGSPVGTPTPMTRYWRGAPLAEYFSHCELGEGAEGEEGVRRRKGG